MDIHDAETNRADAARAGPRKIYGIDLGTTYSCIAHVDGVTNRAEIIRNKDNEAVTPSVLLFDPPDEMIVGKFAKAESILHADRVAQLFKRRMKDPEWRFTISDTEWAGQPEWGAAALSSRVLAKLAEDVNEMTGQQVKSVVITVPAYFGEAERQATKQAGELAGLDVVGIVNEPTAAAFAYGLGSAGAGASETVLVFDLGGGTFDITVIAIEPDRIRVVATDGDHELGGTDWDARAQGFLASEFAGENPDAGDPLDDPDSEQELANHAETTKQQLTERARANSLVQHGGERASIELTRERFAELTADLLTRTVDLTRSVIGAAREKGSTEISKILLVGGSTKMPMVREALEREFGLPIELSDPDLAVAKGAALYGQMRGFEEVIEAAVPEDREQTIEEIAELTGMSVQGVTDLTSREVTNVCSQGFGLGVLNEQQEEYVDFLIHRNDPVPVEIEKTYGTVVDNQTEVVIAIYEQVGEENPDPDRNKLLMKPEIQGIPPGAKRGTDIYAKFRMGDDGTLALEARHKEHDQPLQVELNVAGAISREELAQQREAINAIALKS